MSLADFVEAAEQTPTASVTVDAGVEFGLSEWSVSRSIASDLPAQVTGVRGQAVAEADVTLLPPADSHRGHMSPWRNPARRIKTPISIDVGLSGENVRVFTGQVLSDGGSADHSGVAPLALECEDTLNALRKKVSLPGIGSRMSDGFGGTFNPGISPGWAMDTILRQHGYYTTPPPEPDCLASVPCQDSLWPEAPAPSDPGSAWASTTGIPEFTTTPYGRAAVESDLLLVLGETVPFAVGATLRLAMVTGATGSASSALLLQTFLGASEIGLVVSSGSVSLTSRKNGTPGTPAVFTHAGGPVVADLERTSATAIAYSVTTNIAGAPTTATGTLTVNSTLYPETDPVRLVRVQAGGFPIAGVQVGRNTTDPSTTLAHVKGTDLDVSMGAIAAVPPGLDGVGVEVLTAIASAEFGAMWMSESGVPTFRNRDTLRGVGQTPEVVTSHDKLLTGMAWTRDTSSLRSAVEIPVNPARVQTASTASIAVWQSDSAIEIPAKGHVEIIADALGNVGAIDRTVTGVDGGDATPNPTTGSYYRNLSPGGVYAPVCTITATLIGPSRIRINIANREDYAVNLTREDGEPALVLRARTLITQDEAAALTVRAENPWLVAEGVADELTLDANPWRQDIAAAGLSSRWLAKTCSRPIPVLQTVRVVFDPRRKLGDVIVLRDDSVTGIRSKALITGISLAGSAASATQELTVRLLPWSIGEVSDAWPGQTVGDFNAYWSGYTVGDFNAQPLGRLG